MTNAAPDYHPELLGPRSPDRYGHWLLAPDGRRLYPFDMRVEDLDIRHIARSLSREPRWCGFTREPYFVAQHLVICSHSCDPADALWGLAHDFPEYLMRDLPSPIKHMPEMAEYRLMEAMFMNVVCDWLGLPYEMPASVRRADKIVGATEARDLFDRLDPEWAARLATAETLAGRVEAWDSGTAERVFLERFHELTDGRFS